MSEIPGFFHVFEDRSPIYWNKKKSFINKKLKRNYESERLVKLQEQSCQNSCVILLYILPFLIKIVILIRNLINKYNQIA